MRTDLLEKFNSSYNRVVGTEDFFDRFYARFLSCSEEVAAKFRNTDMQKQKDILRMSLIFVVNFFANRHAGERLHEMAQSHSQENLDIHPRLYQLWIDALVDTVREVDPDFETETELAWRVVLAPGIEFMKFYHQVNR